jgi:hypothetical protein
METRNLYFFFLRLLRIWPCGLFQFINTSEVINPFRHLVEILGRGISHSQRLHLHRTAQRRKTRTNIHALSGIRTHDPRLRPRGECDWCNLHKINAFFLFLLALQFYSNLGPFCCRLSRQVTGLLQWVSRPLQGTGYTCTGLHNNDATARKTTGQNELHQSCSVSGKSRVRILSRRPTIIMETIVGFLSHSR